MNDPGVAGRQPTKSRGGYNFSLARRVGYRYYSFIRKGARKNPRAATSTGRKSAMINAVAMNPAADALIAKLIIGGFAGFVAILSLAARLAG